MRAFLAVPVSGAALDEGVQLLDRLRGALPGVRWVRGEGLHLTLHFFADLAESDVPRVVDAARDAAERVQPYRMQLGGLGCFPREGDERVLWIGMLHGREETAALQRAAENALQARGFEPEPRAFAPHVTLGRPRERFTSAARRRWQQFADDTLSPCEVRDVCLYRSHMGAGGSRYEVLDRIPLSAAR